MSTHAPVAVPMNYLDPRFVHAEYAGDALQEVRWTKHKMQIFIITKNNVARARPHPWVTHLAGALPPSTRGAHGHKFAQAGGRRADSQAHEVLIHDGTPPTLTHLHAA